MPCYEDSRDDSLSRRQREEAHEERQRLDARTDMLCRVCRLLESKDKLGLLELPPDVQAWFAEHKRFDAAH